MASERKRAGWLRGEWYWSPGDDCNSIAQGVAVCRPSMAKKFLESQPEGRVWRRMDFEAYNVVVFVEDLFMGGVLGVRPEHRRKLQAEFSEWSRLLAVPVEVGSAQGRG